VTRGARVLLLGPYVVLLVVFFMAPLLLMLAISFSRQSYGQLEWSFTAQHYIHFFTDAYYLTVLADTLWLGVLTTVASLLLGYPLAYHLALTRGLINATLMQHGWLSKPLPLMYNKFGVTLALVHVFLPFMVLSLTGVLKRIEPQLIEASQTLGASPRRAFLEVTLPLSLPGILAGSLLVFSLAISSFVVPILVGGFKVHVLPMVVYEQVLSVFDWPFGAANAFVLLVISVALIAVYIKVTERALRGIV
jgi:putative spermidine/putrescine transport system permease protein